VRRRERARGGGLRPSSSHLEHSDHLIRNGQGGGCGLDGSQAEALLSLTEQLVHQLRPANVPRAVPLFALAENRRPTDGEGRAGEGSEGGSSQG
jgi:hypothetical protein